MTGWTVERLKIVETEQPVGPGDDAFFVTVRTAGENGWYGPIGERVARYVHDMLAPEMQGARVVDGEGILDQLRAVARGAPSDVASWAVGSVDCAVWDLHGKLHSRSVADLLAAGKSRSNVPAYASWLSHDLANFGNFDLLRDIATGGWRFTKWGLRRDASELPTESATRMARAVERCVQAVGVPLAVDAVGTWTPSLAMTFAQRCDPSHLLWLEDPLPNHGLDVYELLAAARLPLAVGEHAHCDEDPAGLIQYARPRALTLDVVGCGGLTRAVQILAVARSQAIPIYPHGRSLLPGLHLAAAFPDAVPAVEYRLQWEPVRQRLYAVHLQPMEGHFHLPDSPGLGTTPRSSAWSAHQ